MSKTFEDLEVWSRRQGLAVKVCRAFEERRDYGFRNQITRSCVSVTSNSAERAERNTKPEFAQFPGYAKGSLAELRTPLLIARDLDYLAFNEAAEMLNEAEQLARMLYRPTQSQQTASS